MNEPAAPSENAPPKRVARPWWRWNLITLAALLFVALWVRELSGLRLGATWWLVVSVGLVWWLAPSVFLRRLPKPQGFLGTIEVEAGEPVKSKRWSAAWVCRAAAVLIACVGVWRGLVVAYWLFQVVIPASAWGRGGYSFATSALVAAIGSAVEAFCIAVALWTLGSLATAVEHLVIQQGNSAPPAEGDR